MLTTLLISFYWVGFFLGVWILVKSLHSAHEDYAVKMVHLFDRRIGNLFSEHMDQQSELIASVSTQRDRLWIPEEERLADVLCQLEHKFYIQE